MATTRAAHILSVHFCRQSSTYFVDEKKSGLLCFFWCLCALRCLLISFTHPQYATRKHSSGGHILTQWHAVSHVYFGMDVVKVSEEFGGHPLATSE
jgi:hypothetical protein